MSLIEFIETILNPGKNMDTYRVEMNPGNYRWRIVNDRTNEVALDVEWETKNEAETFLMSLSI